MLSNLQRNLLGRIAAGADLRVIPPTRKGQPARYSLDGQPVHRATVHALYRARLVGPVGRELGRWGLTARARAVLDPLRT